MSILPAVPLTWQAVTSEGVTLGETFGGALVSSLFIALLVGLVALVVGLPGGVLAALCTFRGHNLLLVLVTLTALAPSFLWAIGWSAFAAQLGPSTTNLLSGYTGSILVFCATAVPIVLLTAFAATRALTDSQIQAARLAGGDRGLLYYASRNALPAALLGACLASVLTLSDPGPGQILAVRTAASEILTSFSALYDFGLAGRQCITLAFVVLVLIVPLVIATAPRLSSELLAKQVRSARPLRSRAMVRTTVVVLSLVAFVNLALPLIGLLLPLGRNVELGRAWDAVRLTGVNTLLYATGAGLTAAILGFTVAFIAGRERRLRVVCLACSVALFAQPPALIALGLVQFGTWAPEWADPLLRGRAVVFVALGIRLFPVAAVLGLRARSVMPFSWTAAGAVHGVPLTTYVRRVVIPFLLPTVLVSTLLVGLLATADLTTVLLLHPPGEPSLPLTIFTVMANAPESLVASLCLVYVSVAGILLAACLSLAKGQRT